MMAPMVGLSHYAVRHGIQSFLYEQNPSTTVSGTISDLCTTPFSGTCLWPTEMLSSRRIPAQKANQNPEIFFYDSEYGLCPQLLANEEKPILQSVQKLEEWGAKAIDINMGCPVKKALKHNYGVALMGDPNYAAEVVRITKSVAKVPVSVKLRATAIATNNTSTDTTKATSTDYLLGFTEKLINAGADWITLHPRTPDQQRKGNADWNIIKELKNAHKDKIKIIGNGDVQCQEDIANMFENTHCDRVMIGRALLAKPWLIRNQPEPDPYTQGEWFKTFLLTILTALEQKYPEPQGMRRLRFLMIYSKNWLEFGETLYGKMHSAKNYSEIKQTITRFFQQKQKMIKRTNLRQ